MSARHSGASWESGGGWLANDLKCDDYDMVDLCDWRGLYYRRGCRFFIWRRVLVWALQTHLRDQDSEFRKLLGLDEGEEWKRGTDYE